MLSVQVLPKEKLSEELILFKINHLVEYSLNIVIHTLCF